MCASFELLPRPKKTESKHKVRRNQLTNWQKVKSNNRLFALSSRAQGKRASVPLSRCVRIPCSMGGSTDKRIQKVASGFLTSRSQDSLTRGFTELYFLRKTKWQRNVPISLPRSSAPARTASSFAAARRAVVASWLVVALRAVTSSPSNNGVAASEVASRYVSVGEEVRLSPKLANR